jgi:hypothetical protein
VSPILARMVEGPLGQIPHAQVYAQGLPSELRSFWITCLHVIWGNLSQISSLAASGTGGLGRSRAHGDFPYPGEAFNLRHEPCGGLRGAANLWRPQNAPEDLCIRRMNLADCDREPPVGSDSSLCRKK